MKKIPVLCVILAVAILLSGYSALATENETAAVTQGCSSVNARVPLGGTAQLAETAKAVILYELNTDMMVYSYHADDLINPTGMVKILTALVALENGNLDDEVTVKRSTLDTVTIGAVSANLKSREVISVRDLLYCVMVASANDAAAVLAEHIAGSQAEFVAMMNQKAVELGCTSSNFTNVHGLYSADQFSTARDLAIITRAALENELFSEMFSTDSYTVPATNKSEERYIITTNYMMSDEYIKNQFDSRVTGGKTAAASLTDRSLICTAEKGTSRYLCIVMSAQAVVSEDGFVVQHYGSFEETKVVLDYGFQNFAVRQVVDQNQVYAQYSVSGGENDLTVCASTDFYSMLPLDYDPEKLVFEPILDAGLLVAPIEKGAIVGTLKVSYDHIVLGSTDLQAIHSVAQAGTVIQNADFLQDEAEDAFDFKGLFVKIGIVAGCLLLLAVAILIIIRMIQVAKLRRHHRRRKQNRRRSR